MRRVACLREGWTGIVCQSGVTLRLAGSRSSQDCDSSRRLTGPAVDQWTTRNHHAAQQINKKTQQQQHPPCRWLWGYTSPDTQPLHTEAASATGLWSRAGRCTTGLLSRAGRCTTGLLSRAGRCTTGLLSRVSRQDAAPRACWAGQDAAPRACWAGQESAPRACWAGQDAAPRACWAGQDAAPRACWAGQDAAPRACWAGQDAAPRACWAGQDAAPRACWAGSAGRTLRHSRHALRSPLPTGAQINAACSALYAIHLALNHPPDTYLFEQLEFLRNHTQSYDADTASPGPQTTGTPHLSPLTHRSCLTEKLDAMDNWRW